MALSSTLKAVVLTRIATTILSPPRRAPRGTSLLSRVGLSRPSSPYRRRACHACYLDQIKEGQRETGPQLQVPLKGLEGEVSTAQRPERPRARERSGS